MPLVPAILQDEILKLTDKRRADFKGFPKDPEATAENWSGVAEAFFALIVTPPLAALLAPIGKAAFKEAMKTALENGAAIPALAAGFTAFAAVLGAIPLAAPPPSPLQIPIGPPTPDPAPQAANMAGAIFSWATTGTFNGGPWA